MINTEGVPQDFQKNDSNISESVNENQTISHRRLFWVKNKQDQGSRMLLSLHLILN